MNNYILNCKSGVASRRTTPRARLARRRVASQCAWRHATKRPALLFIPPKKVKESRRLGQIVNLRRQVVLSSSGASELHSSRAAGRANEAVSKRKKEKKKRDLIVRI